ncbi:MAG: hypothetical protein CL786_02490 [Chloroflexi bacterium]|nr:hypothetical protein [Chloroflexota bacterium]|tara:strand:+ start:2290 stop:3615 length:1326 start_codon:yes stop_codon:yes gene_type:complete
MSRKDNRSEEKVMVNEKLYINLHDDYLDLLQHFSEKFPIVEDAKFGELVNFKNNMNLSKHNWFEYKQGYAGELVRELIDSNKLEIDSYVLDPFCGVGTTNLVAQSLGFDSFGFDVLPVAILAASVKTQYYSSSDQHLLGELIKGIQVEGNSEPPALNIIRKAFSSETIQTLMGIKEYYKSLSSKKYQDFFKLAYLSIIEECSNRVKDGNGLKISRNKSVVTDVLHTYREKVVQMHKDIQGENFSAKVNLIQGSFLELNDQIADGSVGLTITSPPYANCFDYCELYKFELWMGEYVCSYSDFSKYRSGAIRSHVNSSFNHDIEFSNSSVDLIAELISCFNIWNKNIPDMLRGYFDDMRKILTAIYRVTKSGGKTYIIVGNSSYKGIIVPTDLLLSEIAEKIGFEVKPLIFARNLRRSSQQINEIAKTNQNLARETILVFQKL